MNATEITLAARTENIPAVTEAIETELDKAACPPKIKMQFGMAVDEIFGNIARYAYPDGAGDATVRFAFDPDARTVSLTFIDSGFPFDPTLKDDPDTSLPPDERDIGGLGIFLVKKIMDEVCYRREEGKNILTVVKKI